MLHASSHTPSSPLCSPYMLTCTFPLVPVGTLFWFEHGGCRIILESLQLISLLIVVKLHLAAIAQQRVPMIRRPLLLLVIAAAVARHAVAADQTNNANNDYQYHPSEFVISYGNLRDRMASASFSDSYSDGDRSCLDRRSDDNKIIVAAVQMASSVDFGSGVQNSTSGAASLFLERAERAVNLAVKEHGANLVLLQELFLGPYFCQSQDGTLFGLAEDLSECAILDRMKALAKRLSVVLPISIFERKNNAYFNSVVMIDADGENLGVYRKSHIPDGTGYMEKFYFSPGDTGFRVFNTKVGKVGVGICWDQWFPEAARSMALMGADVLLYPTAIGSEPQDPDLDSADHWQRVMQGHAAANMVPVVASNRVGVEVLLDDSGKEKQRIKFYGRSFITDETGAIIREAKDLPLDIISASIDAEKNRATRAAWGLFRDRRPELYGILKTKDGEQVMAS